MCPSPIIELATGLIPIHVPPPPDRSLISLDLSSFPPEFESVSFDFLSKTMASYTTTVD